jgi:hypothetical protein
LTTIEAEARNLCDQRRQAVESSTFELSRARILAAKASEESIVRLRQIYRQELENPLVDLSDLTKTIAERIAQARERIEALTKLKERKDSLGRQIFPSPARQKPGYDPKSVDFGTVPDEDLCCVNWRIFSAGGGGQNQGFWDILVGHRRIRHQGIEVDWSQH